MNNRTTSEKKYAIYTFCVFSTRIYTQYSGVSFGVG